ncbi:serine hydrolase [Lacibacter sediminis]|uniref:Serine hydrolase n=1 Tax=Lacibacter sediminis TaxID=2760713 RepID=A0A7G5XIT7_9BACT|nr:serine hydrolase [Lacibacter sediminis]QNA45390.1 serine hydrolase [Lacibacter sediminis]
MKKMFFLCIAVILLQSANAQTTEKRLAGLDTFINRILKEWSAAGVTVAVVEKNKVIMTRGFGYKDYENKVPVTENTLFAIGSCTKAFTSSLLAFPMKEGKLDLDKPVTQYLPELRFIDDELNNHVTARDMMSHRTGLPRHDLAWYGSRTKRDSLIYIIRYFEKTAPLRRAWQYNNFMFLAQGVLAEKLSGKSWDVLVREHLFTPLNMTASNTSMNDHVKSPDYSFGYNEKDGAITKMKFMNIDGIGPAGSINSNAKDMANWVMMWVNGGKFNGKEILPAAYYNQAISSQMVTGAGLPTKEQPDVFLSNYGFAWFLANYRGHYRVEHGGNIDGFSSSTSFFPTDSIGIFVSVNQNGSPIPGIIRNTIADKLLGLKYKDWHRTQKTAVDKAKAAAKEKLKADSTQRKMGTRPTHAITDYAGTFTNEGYGTLTIEQQKDSLVAKYNALTFKVKHYHFNYFNFIPVADGVDAGEDDAMKGQFNINIKGEIESLSLPLQAGVKDIEFKKKVETIDVSKADLEKYVGEYELPGPTLVKVYIKGEKTLVAFVTGQTDYELIPVKPDVFNLKIVSGFSVRFEKNDAGEVTALYFVQPNGTFKATRKK